MKKALFTTALIGTLGISGIIGYAATNTEQPAANTVFHWLYPPLQLFCKDKRLQYFTRFSMIMLFFF